MKIKVPGNTPMERLTEFTRRIIAVPKTEIVAADKKRGQKARQRRRSRSTR